MVIFHSFLYVYQRVLNSIESIGHLDTLDFWSVLIIAQQFLQAEALEGSCNAAGCSDPHTMSKAKEAKLDRQKVAPPPALPEEVPLAAELPENVEVEPQKKIGK